MIKKKIKIGYCQCGCGKKTKLAYRNLKRLGWVKGEHIKYIYGHSSFGINKGEKSGNWKGENVSKSGLHRRIRDELGRPKICWECGTTDKYKLYDWANISGKYKHDTKDFKRLCRKCHRNFDIDILPRGEDCKRSKLKNKEVLKIRELYNTNKYTQQKISEMFGVSRTNITNIVNKKIWTHI